MKYIAYGLAKLIRRLNRRRTRKELPDLYWKLMLYAYSVEDAQERAVVSGSGIAYCDKCGKRLLDNISWCETAALCFNCANVGERTQERRREQRRREP